MNACDINENYLSVLIGPIAMAAETDSPRGVLEYVDGGNKEQVNLVINNLVDPIFKAFDEQTQMKVKESLRYCLNKESTDFERIYSSVPYPLYREEPREFFEAVWKSLFADECLDRPIDVSYTVSKRPLRPKAIRYAKRVESLQKQIGKLWDDLNKLS